MSKQKTMTLWVLLVAILLLTACTSGNNNAATNNTAGNGAKPENTAASGQTGQGEGEDRASDMTPLGKYPEQLPVSISKVMQTNPHLIEGQSPEDNIMLDWIREELNIDISIAWQAISGEYDNKLALNVVSESLPDIIYIPSSSYLTFRQMVDNGMLADLTEAYELAAGDYLKSTYATFEGRNLEPLTIDGKLYALSSANIGYGHNVLWLRSDWLAALDLEVPTTMEELRHVLQQFVDKDPGGNGPGNTLGLAVHATKPVSGYGNKFGLEPIFHSYGAYPWQWMQNDNGDIYYGSTAPEIKAALAEVRALYEDGLIDRQFLARIGSGEIDALVDSGLSGAFFAPWWGVSADVFINNPDVSFVAVNAPLDTQGRFNHLTPAPTGDLIAVNKNFSNPEALLKIVNLTYDMYRGINKEGLAAIQPIFDQGVSREAIFPTGGFNLDYYDVVPKLGKIVKELVETGVMGGDETTTDYDRWKAEGAQRHANGQEPTATSAVNDFRDYYGRYIGSNILDTPENNPVSAAYSYTTASSVTLKPTLDKLEEQMYLQIITGEKPIDYFDEFVAEWNRIGGDVLTREVQELMQP